MIWNWFRKHRHLYDSDVEYYFYEDDPLALLYCKCGAAKTLSRKQKKEKQNGVAFQNGI